MLGNKRKKSQIYRKVGLAEIPVLNEVRPFFMKIHENERKNDATASSYGRKIHGERTAQKNVKLRKSPCIKGFGLLQYTSDREDVRGC